MNIDGVDFWGSNRHILRMWDSLDRVGPLVILIEDKVRVGEPFTVYLQYEQSRSLYHLLRRQLDTKHVCTMNIVVEEPKKHEVMYDILFRVVLSKIKVPEEQVSNLEPNELFLTYICKEAIDRTVYDNTI